MDNEGQKNIRHYDGDLYSLLFKDGEDVENKALFIVKKLEKLSTVLYKITDQYDQFDPLKNELRRLALESVSVTLSSNVLDKKTEVVYILLKIVSFLSIACGANKISSGNYLILRSEYENICHLFDPKDSSEGPENKSLRAYLQEDVPLFKNISTGSLSVSPHVPEINVYKGQKDNINMSFKNSLKNKGFLNNAPAKNQPRVSNLDRDSRAEKIMSLIKIKGVVSIKDVSSQLKDTGEKTIQRELLRLVEIGRIKKEGERRWSKYSLA